MKSASACDFAARRKARGKQGRAGSAGGVSFFGGVINHIGVPLFVTSCPVSGGQFSELEKRLPPINSKEIVNLDGLDGLTMEGRAGNKGTGKEFRHAAGVIFSLLAYPLMTSARYEWRMRRAESIPARRGGGAACRLVGTPPGGRRYYREGYPSRVCESRHLSP